MKTNKLAETVRSFNDCKDPGFNPEIVGQALGCEYNDRRIYDLDTFDFDTVDTEKLKKIVAYIQASLYANSLANEL
jgi:hypothetical protein